MEEYRKNVTGSGGSLSKMVIALMSLLDLTVREGEGLRTFNSLTSTGQ